MYRKNESVLFDALEIIWRLKVDARLLRMLLLQKLKFVWNIMIDVDTDRHLVVWDVSAVSLMHYGSNQRKILQYFNLRVLYENCVEIMKCKGEQQPHCFNNNSVNTINYMRQHPVLLELLYLPSWKYNHEGPNGTCIILNAHIKARH